MPYLKGFEVSRFVGFGMGMGAVLAIAGAGFGNRANGEKIDPAVGKFEIMYPDLSILQPCVAEDPSPCAAEAAALAAALSTLDAARASAEALYDAYIECMDQNGGGPSPQPVNPQPVNPQPIDPDRPASFPIATPSLAGTVSILAN